MKAWMKRNNELQSTYNDFTEFLEAALTYMANKAGSHFRSAGIIVGFLFLDPSVHTQIFFSPPSSIHRLHLHRVISH